jgi:hypothetical protein
MSNKSNSYNKCKIYKKWKKERALSKVSKSNFNSSKKNNNFSKNKTKKLLKMNSKFNTKKIKLMNKISLTTPPHKMELKS